MTIFLKPWLVVSSSGRPFWFESAVHTTTERSQNKWDDDSWHNSTSFPQTEACSRNSCARPASPNGRRCATPALMDFFYAWPAIARDRRGDSRSKPWLPILLSWDRSDIEE